MKAIFCEKCQTNFKESELISHGIKLYTTLPPYLCPNELDHDDTHLCYRCSLDLEKVIAEWFGFKRHRSSCDCDDDGEDDSCESSGSGVCISMDDSDAHIMAEMSGLDIG